MHTKIIAWIVLLALCLCLSACKENEQSSETTPYYLDAHYWYRKDAEAALANIPIHVLEKPCPGTYRFIHYSEPYVLICSKMRQLPALNRGLPLESAEDYKAYILMFHNCLRLLGYNNYGFPYRIYYYADDVISVGFPSAAEMQLQERAKGRGIDPAPNPFAQMGTSGAYVSIFVDCKKGELFFMA